MARASGNGKGSEVRSKKDKGVGQRRVTWLVAQTCGPFPAKWLRVVMMKTRMNAKQKAVVLLGGSGVAYGLELRHAAVEDTRICMRMSRWR